MGLKVAVAGKGGVGKTTVAGSLARVWAREGMKVLAIDADPASHLHSMLGICAEDQPRPISEELDLIEERTGARPGSTSGPFYKLNPRVDDIPDKYSREGADGVRLLVLGTIKSAGSGCFCPENAILRALLEHIILDRDDVVIADMEAGLEQFGRATSRGVDALLIVVVPGMRSVETAARIFELARGMGMVNCLVVANMVAGDEEQELLSEALASRGMELFHILPFSKGVARADLEGTSSAAVAQDDWLSSVRHLSHKISEIARK